MEYLWSHDEGATVREVLDGLRDRSLAYTTVMTVLDRLWSKRVVSRRRVGRAYVYRPRITEQDHAATLMEEVLSTAVDRQSVLLGFLRSVDGEELDEIRRLVREVERERKRTPGR